MRIAAVEFVVALIVTSAAAGAASGQATVTLSSGLRGVVVDSAGDGIPYAQVLLSERENLVTADQDGNFYLPSLPAGKNLFQARRIGFDPLYFRVDIPAGATVSVRIRMHQNIRELSTVAVLDIREPLRRVGFYERMAAGSGHFITPEALESRRPVRATDVFMNIPNLVVDRRGAKSRLMTSNYKCEYALVIDKVAAGEPGSRVRTTSPDDLVSASDLYAVEVYPQNRGLPAQFLGMSHEDGCGTIIIWTKGMIAR